jgi:hypothetical protein
MIKTRQIILNLKLLFETIYLVICFMPDVIKCLTGKPAR